MHDMSRYPYELGEGLSIIEEVGPSVCESKSVFALRIRTLFSVRRNIRTEEELILEDAGPNKL